MIDYFRHTMLVVAKACRSSSLMFFSFLRALISPQFATDYYAAIAMPRRARDGDTMTALLSDMRYADARCAPAHGARAPERAHASKICAHSAVMLPRAVLPRIDIRACATRYARCLICCCYAALSRHYAVTSHELRRFRHFAMLFRQL